MKYREPRKPLDKEVRYKTERGAGVARALNISASGIQIETERPLAVGTRILIELVDKPREATVVWSRSRLSGLRFDQPLNPMALKAFHRPQSISHRQLRQAQSTGSVHGFGVLR